MTKKAAPASVTGGAGFGYADRVAALFLAHQLAGTAPLGYAAEVVDQLDFEVRDSGWLLDDLAVTLQGTEGKRVCAISIKSDRQVTCRGFPNDFTERVWEQWLCAEAEPFDAGRGDVFCLVVGKLADGVESAWNGVAREAKEADPSRLVQRLTTEGLASKTKRALFGSIQCPPALQAGDRTDELAAARLLKHIRLIHMDFDAISSRTLCDALGRCRQALASGDAAEGTRLWDRLVAIAAEQRQVGGTLSLRKLIAKLRAAFHLREHPDYGADWTRMRRLSNELMEDIRTDVASRVSLLRQDTVESLRGDLAKYGHLLVAGESGCGKSALVKVLADPLCPHNTIVWLNGEVLDEPDLAAMEQRLRLEHPLGDVFASCREQKALLVFDALDRFTPQALRATALIIRQLEPASAECPWRIVLTAQVGMWESAFRELMRYGVPSELFHVVPIPPPTVAEIHAVMEAVAAVRDLGLRKELQPALRNLKVLDWVLTEAAADSGVDARGWAGLSDVVDWVWEHWAGPASDRFQRGSLLKAIGDREATTLAVGVRLSDLDTAQQGVLGGLEASHLVSVKDERVRFTHDLVGDWARLRLLIEEEPVTAEILKARVPNVRWQQAIRLYGQRLLEQDRVEPSRWRALMGNLDDRSDEAVLARDLLLESMALGVNAGELLEREWAELIAEEGLLLNRLLRRFMHSATLPDPRIDVLFDDVETAKEMTAVMRVPYWPYWGSVLACLHRHKDDVVRWAGHNAALACRLWLENMPVKGTDGEPWLGRQEAADLAVAIGREVQGRKAEGVFLHGGVDEEAYRAALAGAPDMPDEVSALALELCRRRPEAQEVVARAKAADQQRAEEMKARIARDPDLLKQRPTLIHPKCPLRPPWPDGPLERIDHAFQKVCLSTPALQGLTMVRPEVAREVLLAVCIEAPRPDDPNEMHLMPTYGTDHWSEGSPPMFFGGPFLQYLRFAPEHGLDVILTLVNFATQRWQEQVQKWRRRQGDPDWERELRVTVPLPDGPKRWQGNSNVYGWYRDLGINAPCVVSALMAVEKWLYEEVEAGHDIARWISQIWEKSDSVAIAGVLSALGRRHPRLLLGSLQPMLGIWQVYQWEQKLLLQDDAWRTSLLSWCWSGEYVFNTVRDWHALSHRKVQLQDLAVQLLTNSADTAEFFGQVRGQWREELAALKDGDERKTLELLTARFDATNYHKQLHEDGKTYMHLEWPEPIRAETEQGLRRSGEAVDLIAFPFRCRQLLDRAAKLTSQQCDELWEQLQRIVALAAGENDGDSSRPVEDIICGGIAVLVVLSRAWLHSHPDKDRWCTEQLRSVLSDPPSLAQFDIPHSLNNTRWDRFAAVAIVVLFAENPTDAELRSWVAGGVAANHYETTAALMSAAHDHNEELGDEFGRLQNLAVMWSAARCLRDTAQAHNLNPTIWNNWIRRILGAFVDGRLPSAPVEWQRIAAIGMRGVDRINRRAFPDRFGQDISHRGQSDRKNVGVDSTTDGDVSGTRRRLRPRGDHPGLDLAVIEAAFAWSSRLDRAGDVAGRQMQVHCLREMLAVTVGMIASAEDDDDGEVPGSPYKYDCWVFDQLAAAIGQMSEGEQPEQLWQPVFDLGPRAHNWIERFLTSWFIHGLQSAGSVDEFAERWHSMIAYAIALPSWAPGTSRVSFQSEKLFRELLGLGSGASAIAETKFRPAIARLHESYERWAKQWLRDCWGAAAFSRFLMQPSAYDLVCPGICWLHEAVAKYRDYEWREGLDESLVRALRVCWTQHLEKLQANAQLREHVLGLLALLSKRQSAAALELQDVVLRELPG